MFAVNSWNYTNINEGNNANVKSTMDFDEDGAVL